MTSGTGDFELTMDELRVVARFAAESAGPLVPMFEATNPGDARPRAALDAAWEFAHGAPRSKLQRITSMDAHRAAKEAASEVSRLAARAAGDAASSAYLHPLSKASQVGHILRAAALAARIAELNAENEPDVGLAEIERSRQRATSTLIDILRRYPKTSPGRNRVSVLLHLLDLSLRDEP